MVLLQIHPNLTLFHQSAHQYQAKMKPTQKVVWVKPHWNFGFGFSFWKWYTTKPKSTFDVAFWVDVARLGVKPQIGRVSSPVALFFFPELLSPPIGLFLGILSKIFRNEDFSNIFQNSQFFLPAICEQILKLSRLVFASFSIESKNTKLPWCEVLFHDKHICLQKKILKYIVLPFLLWSNFFSKFIEFQRDSLLATKYNWQGSEGPCIQLCCVFLSPRTISSQCYMKDIASSHTFNPAFIRELSRSTPSDCFGRTVQSWSCPLSQPPMLTIKAMNRHLPRVVASTPDWE